MTTYRFINRDHTLVMRDDHVIYWDAKLNQPVDPQPSEADKTRLATPDKPVPIEQQTEMQIWKDAGSPKPVDLITRDVPVPPVSPSSGVEWEQPFVAGAVAEIDPDSARSISDAIVALDEIGDPTTRTGQLSLTDLQKQVQLLTLALRSMVIETKKPHTMLFPIIGPEDK